MSIADLRRNYTLAGLRRVELEADPIQQFQKWLQQAVGAQLLEPTAMTLATADQNRRPSARGTAYPAERFQAEPEDEQQHADAEQGRPAQVAGD